MMSLLNRIKELGQLLGSAARSAWKRFRRMVRFYSEDVLPELGKAFAEVIKSLWERLRSNPVTPYAAVIILFLISAVVIFRAGANRRRAEQLAYHAEEEQMAEEAELLAEDEAAAQEKVASMHAIPGETEAAPEQPQEESPESQMLESVKSGVQWDEQQKALRAAEKEAWKNASPLALLEHQRQLASSSFYQKLSAGYDVNILVLGDGLGTGVGATDRFHTWTNLLQFRLQRTYNVTVGVKNLSRVATTVFNGYAELMKLENGGNYDLVILCYGLNDDSSNFGLYYEALIRAAQKKCPQASVICILESSLRSYSPKVRTIQALADHYGLSVADTIAPFQTNYNSYVDGGYSPNNMGQLVYSDTIMEIIEPKVESRYGLDPSGTEMVDPRTEAFSEYRFYPAEMFTKRGNTYTLALDEPIDGIVVGLDCDVAQGLNNCQILADGEEYVNRPYRSLSSEDLPIIRVANYGLDGYFLHAEKELQIRFEINVTGAAQANSFRGICICGR